MSLLIDIKNSISEKVVDNLSSYFNENVKGIQRGVDLSINSFLLSVINYVDEQKSANGLLNILNDGGHNGDILFNLESFSENTEKIKLLETIGGNLINHFIGSKFSGIADSVANLAIIKNTSSVSILNFTAPIVLAFLGQKVRNENMSSDNLVDFFETEKSDIRIKLPSSLMQNFSIINSKNPIVVENRQGKAIPEPKKSGEREGTNWSLILPWVLLGLLGILIYYVSNTKSKKNSDEGKKSTMILSDSLDSEDFLPQTSNIEQSVDSSNGTLLLERDSSQGEKKDDFKNNIETEPKPVAKDLLKVPNIEKDASSILPEKKEVTKKISENKVIQSNSNELKQSSTPKGYSEIANGTFPKNSAEIIDSSLMKVVESLKKGGSITIAPMKGAGRLGEDRAYGIRGYLLENGININQIKIEPSKAGNNNAGVAYKIN